MSNYTTSWNPPRPWPCESQTQELVEHYYSTAPAGSEAVIRETQGGILRYYFTTIEDRTPRRVYLVGHRPFLLPSGTMVGEPHGQCRLVVPTDEIRAYTAQFPPSPGLCYSEKGSGRR